MHIVNIRSKTKTTNIHTLTHSQQHAIKLLNGRNKKMVFVDSWFRHMVLNPEIEWTSAVQCVRPAQLERKCQNIQYTNWFQFDATHRKNACPFLGPVFNRPGETISFYHSPFVIRHSPFTIRKTWIRSMFCVRCECCFHSTVSNRIKFLCINAKAVPKFPHHETNLHSSLVYFTQMESVTWIAHTFSNAED